jgi:tRNA pseudouridine38-40 synthase
MRNIRLVIAYDGTDFHGWQRQPGRPTLQGCIEASLEKIVGDRVHVFGSGRTDAGVHALNQVANFKTDCPIPCENLVKALNDVLPPTVRIKEAREVSDKFHARYDARAKTYRYRILQAPICPPFLWRFVCHYPYPLDHRRMAEAARWVEGEHDFTSFAGSKGGAEVAEEGVVGAAAPPSEEQEQDPGKPRTRADAPLPPTHGDTPSMVRRIYQSQVLWRSRTSLLIYQVRGNGFLPHMVRNIVGTLLEVGRGKLAPEDIVHILEARDRSLAGPTAPPQGLCLVEVAY